MAKDPAFLFYPGDCLQDIQFLNEAQTGVYMKIICSHMKNICLTQQRLNQFTINLTEDEKSGLVEILTEIKGGYCVEWVVDSIGKRRAYSESRRNNRKGKISKSYVKHMENENESINEEDIIKEFKNNFSMKEEAGRHLKETPENIDRLLDEFIGLQKAKGDMKRDLSDLRKHFISWCESKRGKNGVSTNGQKTHFPNGKLIKRDANGKIKNVNDQYN